MNGVENGILNFSFRNDALLLGNGRPCVKDMKVLGHGGGEYGEVLFKRWFRKREKRKSIRTCYSNHRTATFYRSSGLEPGDRENAEIGGRRGWGVKSEERHCFR